MEHLARRPLAMSGLACLPVMLTFLLTPVRCVGLESPEPHAKAILDAIDQTQRRIAQYDGNGARACGQAGCVFLAFWDFDGTILDGDITDGLERDGRQVYTGLQEDLITAGLVPRYRGPGAFARYQRDYRELEAHAGYTVAYAFVAQALAGADVNAVRSAVRERVPRFPPHYYASSVAVLRALEDRGVRNYVISASPDVYVDAAAPSLGLPVERMYGIAVMDKDGRLTKEVLQPVHCGPGKVERLREILRQEQASAGQKQVYVIAAFGNSPHSDGPFLEWVQQQQLPVGRAVSVMINGGTGERIPGLTYVSQTATVQ